MARKKAGEKYKLTLSIDTEMARRFGAYAHFIGEDMSAIFARAIRKEMKGFTVSRRVDEDVQPDGAESATIRMGGLKKEGREAV